MHWVTGKPAWLLLAAAIPLLLAMVVAAAISIHSMLRTSRGIVEDPRWIVGRFHSDVLYYAIALNDAGSRIGPAEAARLRVETAIMRNRLFVVGSGPTRALLGGNPVYEEQLPRAERLLRRTEDTLRSVIEGPNDLAAARLRPALERLQAIAEGLVVEAVERSEAAAQRQRTELVRSVLVAAGILVVLLLLVLALLWGSVLQAGRLSRTLAGKERAEQWQGRLLQVLEQNPVAVMLATLDGIVEYVNPAFTAMTGRRSADVVGVRGGVGAFLEVTAQRLDAILARIADGGEWVEEEHGVRPDGGACWMSTWVTPIRVGGGDITHILVMKEDITLRKEQERQILRHAYHDALTGLPNRMLAMDRLHRALARSERSGLRTVVAFVDLDDFKTVNDTFGHDLGDRLLANIGARLRSVVREGDTVARLGGDEFLVVIEALEGRAEAAAVADKLLDVFSRPFSLEDREFHATASMGLAVYPEDAGDARTLLRYADQAMYRAKEDGKGAWAFVHYGPVTDGSSRSELEGALRDALDNRELALEYQPICSAEDGSLVGAEVLLRWHHPELGSLPAERFVPLAESLGLIVPIGHWVLETAAAQAREWREHHPDLCLYVDLLPHQVWGEDLAGSVRGVLDRAGVPPGALVLEMTESLFGTNRSETEHTLRALRSQGVFLAIEGFGTGRSPLSLLKDFPINLLKIGGTLVQGLPEGGEERMLVSALVAMADGLGLMVVAEGVETPEQLRFLRSCGCARVQGSLPGAPRPPTAFEHSFLAPGWRLGAREALPLRETAGTSPAASRNSGRAGR